MLHAFKWANLNTRMFFRPDEGVSSGGSEAPAAAPASAPGGGGSADGGGGAIPSAAPSTGPAESPGAGGTPAETLFDWSALGSSDDLDHVEIPPEAPVTPPAKPEPPKEPTQPVPPPQPQPAPQPGPQAGEGQSPPLSAADPWRIAEAIEANRDVALAHLAQTKFALSEQDIKDLDTDVVTAVPKLLARVFLESQVSMQKFLAQAVPGMVQKYNRVSSANDGAEKKFFDSHKALDINNPQHRSTTVRIATMYRQANPGIPLDQLIAEVGPMVMASLRMAPGTQAPQARAPSGARSAPGFVPAVNGGGGLSPTPEPSNPWEGLGRNYDE